MKEEELKRLQELRVRWDHANEEFRTKRIPTKVSFTDSERQELKTLSRKKKMGDRKRLGEVMCDWTTAMLFRHDPIRLAVMDCPKDEYEIEAMEILERLAAKPEWTVDEIYEVVWAVFDYMFNVPGRSQTVAGKKEQYLPIAQDIFDKINFPKPGTKEWGEMNQRRGDLIRKSIQGTLNEEEAKEYDKLQRLSLEAVDETCPFDK